MDLRGIEKAVADASLSRGERLAVLEEDFDNNADRLKLLAKASYDSPNVRWPINLANVSDTPLGTGVVSAKVLNIRTEARGSHIHINYFFTSPEINYGFPRGIAKENFTDLIKSDLGWTSSVFSPQYEQVLGEIIGPQIEAMNSTASLLEAALHDESLGNQEVLYRYEQLARAQVA